MNDIEHPAHYNEHPSGVECITIVQHFNFNLGNVIKYVWRAGEKRENSYKSELLKARQYLDFELARIEK